MKAKLYQYPLVRYASFGITLFLIILLIKGGSQNYSYLNTLEHRLSAEPTAVYEELCAYQARVKESDNDYLRLLLCRAKMMNNLPLPSDSVIESWGNRYRKRGNESLYVDYLRLQGDIALNKKDAEAAAGYYKKAFVAEHSFHASVEKERYLERVFYLLAIIAVGVLAMTFWSLWHKRDAELLRKARAQLFLQKKYESSKQYLDKNLNTIAALTEQLAVASNELTQRDVDAIRLQKENLEIRNKEQEVKRSRVSTSLSLIRNSDCGERFYKAATGNKVVLTKNDWAKLSELVVNEFSLLMNRLEQIPNVTTTERKVCLLMLLDIGTLEMSSIIGLGNSSISNAKKSLYEKFTGLKGSAKDLSQEIINIVSLSL